MNILAKIYLISFILFSFFTLFGALKVAIGHGIGETFGLITGLLITIQVFCFPLFILYLIISW